MSVGSAWRASDRRRRHSLAEPDTKGTTPFAACEALRRQARRYLPAGALRTVLLRTPSTQLGLITCGRKRRTSDRGIMVPKEGRRARRLAQ